MPILHSTYRAPWYLPGGLLQTLVAVAYRRPTISFDRETLELPDGDFLDIDWLRNDAENLVIITHGLEGSSHSQYVNDFVQTNSDHAFDILAWNCRSCSGRINRNKRLYHHGEIEDISQVVMHAVETGRYKKIFLAGVSMGGNISTKFLALKPEIAKHVTACGITSTPCDLGSTAAAVDFVQNRIFRLYFKSKLSRKFVEKEKQFPGSVNMEKLKSVKRWVDFDRYVSLPFVGHHDPEKFYRAASPNTYFEQITHPFLLVNAKNDPILQPLSYPTEIAKKKANLFFEYPAHGGHAYFPMHKGNYGVKRVLEFFHSFIK